MTTTLSKATPGPWTVRTGICRNDHPDTSADVHGAHGEFVADCGCHDLANANAHLIAAAPDLYDAIASSMEYLDVMIGPCKPGCDCLLHALHAALAKAEGRQLAEREKARQG